MLGPRIVLTLIFFPCIWAILDTLNDTISVGSIDQLTEFHQDILQKPGHVNLIHLEDTNSFLTPLVQKHWKVEESFLGGGGSFFSRLFSKNKIWVEFYVTDVEESLSPELLPISLCHSELHGDGGSVAIQAAFMGEQSTTGSMVVDIQRLVTALKITASATVENSSTIKATIICTLQHGEIGQLFLRNTRYLHYTQWYRTRVWSPNTRSFSHAGDYKRLGRGQSVVQGGIGEWVCATDSMVDLQCFSMKKKLLSQWLW